MLFESTTLNRQEFAGATLIIESLSMVYLCYAYETNMSSLVLQCWRGAMILRYFPAEGEPLLPKTPDVHIQNADSYFWFLELKLK